MNFSIFPIFKQAIMITGFVFVMMMVIEYINVQTNGIWNRIVSKQKWKQYVFAGLLGLIPGCLGAYTAVALFSHRLLSFGAIVTTMIATSGDEAFVMFAMFPKWAAIISITILVIGIVSGFIVDRFYSANNLLGSFSENSFPLHKEEKCICFKKKKVWEQLQHPSLHRIILILFIVFFLVAIAFGFVEADAKIWIKISLLVTVSFSLFIVLSVPEHFLKKHLWKHIVKVHIPRIFIWTFGTLLIIAFLMQYINVESWISNNMFLVLILAVLLGIIPESGPHLVFVTLFAQGSIPFSILMASSISQDGHGMLPLLAESKKSFFAVKLVNIIIALLTGSIAYLSGF